MIYPVISQVTYPLVGDVDDCSVVSTFWAARDAGYAGRLPTVPEFRRAAGVPDRPGPSGIDNYHVWLGVQGTALRDLRGTLWNAKWEPFALAVKGGASASLATLSSKLPPYLRFGFNGAHRVGVAWDGATFMVANPLAPGGSAPLPCPEATLKAAAYAVSAGYALAVTFPSTLEPDMLKVTNATPVTVDIAVGKQLYDLNGRPFSANHVARNDVYSPFVSGTFRSVVVGLTEGPALLLVKVADATGVKPYPGDVKHKVTMSIDGKPISTTEV